MTLFIKNKYTNWYFNIIENAQSRPKVDGYTEKHHVIPRCMGGKEKDNLAILTAREHFICHWLLTKMVKNRLLREKLAYAFRTMMLMRRPYQYRYSFSSRTFAVIRKNGCFKRSKETKKKMSESMKKAWKTRIKHKRPSGLTFKGKKHTIETKEKISNNNRTRNLKTYKIIFPDNSIQITSNLTQYCMENNYSLSVFRNSIKKNRPIMGGKSIGILVQHVN